jgi:hypothetical protein
MPFNFIILHYKFNPGAAMKIRINKSKRSEKSILKDKTFYIQLIMISLAVVFSASALRPCNGLQEHENLKEKKLDLLQKLESGKQVTSEDIRSSYGNISGNDFSFPEPDFFFLSDAPSFCPEPPLNDPFFYNDYDYNFNDNVVIPDIDLKEIHDGVLKSIEEIKKEAESFRNSDEFINMQIETRKWIDEFKEEVKRMKEDIRKSLRSNPCLMY